MHYKKMMLRKVRAITKINLYLRSFFDNFQSNRLFQQRKFRVKRRGEDFPSGTEHWEKVHNLTWTVPVAH